jgi:hypothetical protein
MDKEKLETAINYLRSYYSTVDNVLYEHYSPEVLEKELDGIVESILYLESLVPLDTN